MTLVDLANGLDKERFSVTIWTIKDGGPLVDELDKEVRYRSLSVAGKYDLRAPVKFTSEIRSDRPDIVQSFLFFDNILARFSGIFSRETTVITGVREVPNAPPLLRRCIDRITLPLSDEIISNSEAGAEYIIERGATPEKVDVVRNGRNLEIYADGEASKDLSESLSLDSDCPIVGTVGRLVKRKGHYDLLEAWPTVLESYPDAQLLIVGEGPEMDGLRERAAELGCEDSIQLPGRRDDIPALLDMMDVFVFPSHYEGLPGALLEAMAAGLPIVATPVDGNAELLNDKRSGLLIPVRDPDSLANSLCRLLSQPRFSALLGDKAANIAKNDFSLEQMIEEFTSLYTDTLSNGH